jgi:PAS domain S-box-containing protein
MAVSFLAAVLLAVLCPSWLSEQAWPTWVIFFLAGAAVGAFLIETRTRKRREASRSDAAARVDGEAAGDSAQLGCVADQPYREAGGDDTGIPSETLGSEKDLLNSLIETAQAVILIVDPAGRVRFVNRFFEQVTGFSLPELQGTDWFEALVPAAERKTALDAFQRAHDTLEIVEHVVAVVTRYGALCHFNWRWKALVRPDGSARAFLGLGVDLTEREGMQDALRKSEERYRAIVEDQTELISRFKPDGTLTFVNGAYCRYFGENPEHLLGHKFWHHVPGHEQERLMRHISSLNRENPVSTIEHPVKTPAGVRWQQWTDRAIFDEEGRVVELQAVGRDITERKRVEQALASERSRLYSVLDSLPVFVFLHSADYAIRFANRCFVRTFGEGAGRRCYSILQNRSEPCDECRSRGVFLDQRPQNWEWAIGRIGRTYQMYSYPFTDADDTPLVLQLGIDITEQKRNELELRQSEAQLRELSASLLTAQEEERQRIAAELHDSIGSSLTGIAVLLQSILLRADEGPPLKDAIQQLITVTENTIQEARRIMSDLRPSMLDDLGILKTLDWLCREFQQLHPGIHIERAIEIEEDAIPDPLKIIIFRLAQEAFHNIAKHSNAEYVTLSLGDSKEMITLVVEDNGDGFPVRGAPWDESLRRGLGLTSMRERTELSGGRFTLESTIGEGTIVKAEWPKPRSDDSRR